MLANNQIKNFAISMLIILSVGGWVSYYTKGDSDAVKQLQKEKKILSDSVKQIIKTNELIKGELRQVHEKTVQDSIKYSNDLKKAKELVSRIKITQSANKNKVDIVRGLGNAETDSIYQLNLRRYANVIR